MNETETLDETVECVYGIADRSETLLNFVIAIEKWRARARKRWRTATNPAVKVLLTFEGTCVRATAALGQFAVRDIRNSTWSPLTLSFTVTSAHRPAPPVQLRQRDTPRVFDPILPDEICASENTTPSAQARAGKHREHVNRQRSRVRFRELRVSTRRQPDEFSARISRESRATGGSFPRRRKCASLSVPGISAPVNAVNITPML